MREKKILIVDDEPDIRNVFQKALSRAGYTVSSAASGTDALEILKTEQILVMFFDLNMPEMDGLELCRRVRKDLPTALIYAVTGYASRFPLTDFQEAGFDNFYSKPIGLALLRSVADAAFEQMEGRTGRTPGPC